MRVTANISVPGIHCDNCKRSIEGALQALNGVEDADVSVADRTVEVVYDDATVGIPALHEAIEEQGFDVAAK